jgi:hypothetical protein
LNIGGNSNLTPTPVNFFNPAGDTVAALIAGLVTDIDAHARQGIAVTGLLGGNKLGSWQFSLDGGHVWQQMGSVSRTKAVVLRDTDLVRFVPLFGFSGPVSFTFKAWDQTKGKPGTKQDSTVGTAFSKLEGVAFGQVV